MNTDSLIPVTPAADDLVASFVCTADGRWRHVSAALSALFGFESAPALLSWSARTGDLLYEPFDERVALLRQALERGRVENAVSQVRRPDGRLLFVQECLTAVHADRPGAETLIHGTATDVTALVTRDPVLCDQCLRFCPWPTSSTAEVRHELSNRLTELLGWAELALMNPAVPDPVRDDLLHLLAATDRLRCASLRLISRLQHGPPLAG